MQSIETIIIGGGQAGLGTSYCLGQLGHEHIILEMADRPAPVWSNGRWDSFTLVTPNQVFSLPGAEYRGPDPDAFMSRDEVVQTFENYVVEHNLPLTLNSRVERVRATASGRLEVVASTGTYTARNVVVATGYEQAPKIPNSAWAVPKQVAQLHSSEYRNPSALPEGAVLVIGSAQSGAQIAEELYTSGRKVFLSLGKTGRAPRKYRGRDAFLWLLDIGFLDLPADKMPMPAEQFSPPHVSGTKGGHTLNLHQFSSEGVTLLGHLEGFENGSAHFAGDLHQVLARVDGFEKQFTQMVDGFVQQRGLDYPQEELPQLRAGFDQPVIEKLDLAANGISSVIWATGYRHGYDFVDIPVFDARGFPLQQQGVTSHPGLLFAGMPWMPGLRTGTLAGVGDVARRTANHIGSMIAA